MKDKETHMTDDEKLQACCKLMARIFSKKAESLNATNINYKVEGITDKDDGKSFGNIRVEWEKE